MKYYAYGIVATDAQLPEMTGLAEETISLFSFQEVALLVSNYVDEEDKPVMSSRKNLLAHQKVVEAMMQIHTILPLQFGTVLDAETAEKMLEDRYNQFQNNLIEFEGKVELNLKATWVDMSSVFAQIANKDEEIQQLKQGIENLDGLNRQNALIEVGKKVQEKLLQSKEDLAEHFENDLKEYVLKSERGKIISDELALNLHFLVDKSQESELDNQIQKVSENYENELRFKYFGPLAPLTFINWEEHD